MKPRALDLFCCAGGATRGLQMAGFHVTGVDIRPQPRYVGDEFHQADALTFPLSCEACYGTGMAPFSGSRPCAYCHGKGSLYDFIWASPPCQAHTAMKTMHNAKRHADLIPATRARLKRAGVPYCIENVDGAPLLQPAVLCGTMFGLGCEDAELRRHRLFELSFPILWPECRHGQRPSAIGVYGGHLRNRKRARGTARGRQDFTMDQGRAAMGIDWMTLAELSQAIPPAYSEFIGKQALSNLVALGDTSVELTSV